METIANSKHMLRKSMLQKRDGLDIVYKNKYDRLICNQLQSIIETKGYRTVHTYLPMGSEINLSPLITQLLILGVKVVCPKTLPRRKLEHLELISLQQTEKGMWGTTHPSGSRVYDGNYDIIIVPGLAFDGNNRRLGYGGGYYDTFLAAHKASCKIAVAYPFQLIDEIPFEEHDAMLDAVISQKSL